MFIPFREKKEYLIQNLGNELLCIFCFGDSALSSIKGIIIIDGDSLL